MTRLAVLNDVCRRSDDMLVTRYVFVYSFTRLSSCSNILPSIISCIAYLIYGRPSTCDCIAQFLLRRDKSLASVKA